MQHPIEGDGIVETFYHFLYMKDRNLQSCPGILVPPTVVFKYQQPAYWFFSSLANHGASAGQMMKKRKQITNSAGIFEGFRAKTSQKVFHFNKTGINSYYICNMEPRAKHFDKVTCVEYLAPGDLEEFAMSRIKTNDGMLQRFVLPKGGKNTLIRVTWSPRFFYVERRQNKHSIYEQRLDMYERAVTYEGREFNATSVPMKGFALNMRFRTICEKIAKHVYQTSPAHHKIKRMVLYFKIDFEDRIWLLWCGHLRVFDEFVDKLMTEAPIPEIPMTVPEHINLQMSASVNHPLMLQRTYQCPSCEDFVESDQITDIAYGNIIDFYAALRGVDPEAFLKNTRNNKVRQQAAAVIQRAFRNWHARLVKEGERKPLGGRRKRQGAKEKVPAIIQNIHPHLNFERYAFLSKKPVFRYKTIGVCPRCATKFTDKLSQKELSEMINSATARRDSQVKVSTMSLSQKIMMETTRKGSMTALRQLYPSETDIEAPMIDFSKTMKTLAGIMRKASLPPIKRPESETADVLNRTNSFLGDSRANASTLSLPEIK